MKIVFELEPDDIQRLDAALDRARRRVECAEELDLVEAARQALAKFEQRPLPGYVRAQFGAVHTLIAILEDEAFALPAHERGAILRTLVYFSDPEDLIPDDEEVVGLLDDAIVLAFVLRRLKPVLSAYAAFCAFRRELGPAPAQPEGRIAHAAALARCRAELHRKLARQRRRLGG